MNTLLANGYRQVEPDCKEKGVYWVAVEGKALAVIPPDLSKSCLATVEEDMTAHFKATGATWGGSDVYVIWQPQNAHQPAVWARWSKKWSARTAARTA